MWSGIICTTPINSRSSPAAARPAPLMDAGYRLFIVTNQSGIGRGYYTEADMHAVNDKLTAELAASDGVAFEKIYYAPESPEQEAGP